MPLHSRLLLAVAALVWGGFSVAWAVAENPAGDLYVLSIGVEPYLVAKGKNDPYGRDAGHMAAALAAADGLYRKVHMRIIASGDAQPAAVTEALGDLSRAVRANDVAVVFFSAHGNWKPQAGYTISLAKQGRQEGVLAGLDLLRVLSAAKGQVLVLLDTCCAGGVIPTQRERLPRVSFLVACKHDEGSCGAGSSKTKPHGYFVLAAVEALRGKADRDASGVVTFGELAEYLPARTKELYNEQHAVLLMRPAAASLPLAKVAARAPSEPTEEAPAAIARNPFGLPDVERPLGKDVAEFNRGLGPLRGGANDENAAAWAEDTASAATRVDGRWAARWKSTGEEWSVGRALIKTADERLFIMYHDSGARYLIEARRGEGGRLVGRYVNLSDESDSAPWVGRVVDNQRIDGYWPGGRWDFRRAATP